MTIYQTYAVIKRGKKTGVFHLDDNLKLGSPLEITERIFNGPDCYPWREVYAWWPVQTIGGKYVWFKKVYKRRFWAVWGTGFHMEPQVEYGTIFDLIQYGDKH